MVQNDQILEQVSAMPMPIKVEWRDKIALIATNVTNRLLNKVEIKTIETAEVV